ncbi:hypothetical protein [Leptolyngbya sp. NIES-2104]|uniref:hypothetical protein n=1 Tax=Leptolyngbya sp. NIES-2104 TaxID=1552121 RepID=UPI0006EC6A62|nr:hypothetical protein [Leptolyngbya sp. NIES-2104]GAP93794.1 hypothetical protein NIES2104_03020 [Leptolyngbya sp. NIES-2104]
MNRITALFHSVAVLGAVFAFATPSAANTPRGTSGINTGSEVAPPTRPIVFPRVPGLQIDRGRLIAPPPVQQRFNQNLIALVRDLRTGALQIPGVSSVLQSSIADVLQTSPGIYRYMEVVGELRTIISQPAVPPTEPGVEVERPGFVRLDLKRQGSTPANIAARFSRYSANLGTRGGQFTIFGNDRQGITRNIEVVLIPKLDRTMEVRFTSNSAAFKSANGQLLSFTAPNAQVASILAGVLPALDAANASLLTMQTAAKIVLALGNVNLSTLEIQQLAQGVSETLIASEGLLSGCGKDAATLTCTDISVNSLAVAIRAYNDLVLRTQGSALTALSNNPEFQTLGAALRRARTAIAQESATR